MLVKVNGQPALIVGYGPGPEGKPMAIVVIDGKLDAVALSSIQLPKLPRKLRHELKHKPVVMSRVK